MTVQQAPTTNNQLWDRLAGGPETAVFAFCDACTLAKIGAVCSKLQVDSKRKQTLKAALQAIEEKFSPGSELFWQGYGISISKLAAGHILNFKNYCGKNNFRAKVVDRRTHEGAGYMFFKGPGDSDGVPMIRGLGPLEPIETYVEILRGVHPVLTISGDTRKAESSDEPEVLAALITAVAFGLNWLLQGY